MGKRPYTLYLYWEDETKTNTHHTKKLKFNTVEEAVEYAKTLEYRFDWTVFDEEENIVADKGDE